MTAVLQYANTYGENQLKTFSNNQQPFKALIKAYVKEPKKKELQVIEKPSTRPATIAECVRFTQKMKQEHGKNLTQLIVWDMDAIERIEL